jgi:hypothetical protein
MTLRFIIPDDGMRQNRRLNAHQASAAEKEFLSMMMVGLKM